MAKKILTMDARLCHSRLTVFKKTHDMDLVRYLSKFQDQVNFGMTLIIKFTGITIALSEL